MSSLATGVLLATTTGSQQALSLETLWIANREDWRFDWIVTTSRSLLFSSLSHCHGFTEIRHSHTWTLTSSMDSSINS